MKKTKECCHKPSIQCVHQPYKIRCPMLKSMCKNHLTKYCPKLKSWVLYDRYETQKSFKGESYNVK